MHVPSGDTSLERVCLRLTCTFLLVSLQVHSTTQKPWRSSGNSWLSQQARLILPSEFNVQKQRRCHPVSLHTSNGVDLE